MATSIFNDTNAPKEVSIWSKNHLTNGKFTCVSYRTFDLTRIGNPGDSRWYAYSPLTHDDYINEKCVLSDQGWVRIDTGMWTPPTYAWYVDDDDLKFVALPAWDEDAAAILGVSFEEWRDIMSAHAQKV